MRLPLILTLLLSACGLDLSAYDQDTAETRHFREVAAAAWADVGVEAPADYQLGLLPSDELTAACQGEATGCTYQGARAILLDASLSPELLAKAIIHETGHLMGPGGHLRCGKDDSGASDIMCPRPGSRTPQTPTARDAAFVQGVL